MSTTIVKKNNFDVNIIMTTEAVLFDPIYCKGYQQFQIINLFLDTLVKKDPKFGIVSGIANKWNVNLSQTEYTFYIDPKATFHNGDKILSRDIKHSFERHLDLKSPSIIGTYLRNIVEKIEIVEEGKIKFFLKGAYPPFLDLLSMSGYGIISAKSTELKIIGSGPFVKGEDKNKRTCLIKRKEYPFNSTNIESFCITLERDVDRTISLLNSQEIDIAMGSPLEVALSERLKTELVSYPTFSLVSTHIFLNHNSVFLKKKENRKLIRDIVLSSRDTDDILTKFDKPLDKFVPMGIMPKEYYSEDGKKMKITKSQKRNNLKIVFPYGIFLEATVKKIVQRFEEAGFKVQYLNVKGKDLLNPIVNGDFDLIFIPYQGVIADPDGYLDLLEADSLLKKASIPSKNLLKEISKERFNKNKDERLKQYAKSLNEFEKGLHIIPFSQNSIPIVYNKRFILPNLNYSYHLNLREIDIK
ncbi:MAG: ABC transporter substrate-binding protein [Pseudobdellovibrio sp.]